MCGRLPPSELPEREGMRHSKASKRHIDSACFIWQGLDSITPDFIAPEKPVPLRSPTAHLSQSITKEACANGYFFCISRRGQHGEIGVAHTTLRLASVNYGEGHLNF